MLFLNFCSTLNWLSNGMQYMKINWVLKFLLFVYFVSTSPTHEMIKIFKISKIIKLRLEFTIDSFFTNNSLLNSVS